MNGQAAKITQQRTQYVSFTIENEIYAIDVLHIQEILREPEITPVPGAPCYVLGVINLRGNVVSVVNARDRFKLPAIESTPMTRIIVVGFKDNAKLGILVDSVAEVVEIENSKIEPPPNVGSDTTSSFIQGVVCRENDLLTLIDVDKLLPDNELELVEVG